MITEAQQAWLIHKNWSGDTSARVVFFTAAQGLVSCYYKGGRNPKKQALLQAFTPLWLIMDVRGDAYFVRQLETAAPAILFERQNLFAAFYVNELLYLALQPLDPHPALYAAYTHTLQALTHAGDGSAIERILRRFEWTVLTSCGYHISLSHDARTAEAILADNFYEFIAGEGFIKAEEGIHGAHLLAISQDQLEEIAILKTAKKIMRLAIAHALDGKEIKSRALYQQF